ncbi:MAG: hypothetical protein ACRCU6_05505 [Fusobacteriaceae bacterium]
MHIQLFKPEKHIIEQAYWRLDQIEKKSPKCFKEGICEVCGCEVSGLVWADATCKKEKEPCYPKMLKTKKEWDNFKTKNNIIIKNVADSK